MNLQQTCGALTGKVNKLGNQISNSGGSNDDSIERAARFKTALSPGPSSLRPIDQHLERIAMLMDKAIRIPGTDITFGLDPLIGFFLPVAGDAIAAIVSAYIVIASVRYRLPKIVIARMVFNIAADFLIGGIPFIGDAADFVLKANTRNMRLLNKHASGERGSSWSDWVWVFVLLGALFGVLSGGLIVIYYAFKASGI